MDPYVLVPQRDALQDARNAHSLYDPPDEPMILSAIAVLLEEIQDQGIPENAEVLKYISYLEYV